MKKSISHYIFWLSLLSFNATAQSVTDGWVIENIHGPSQVGIVDTIPVDINKDGLMDIVSASIEDGHLRAYINQGGHVFEELYISKEVPGIFRVIASDINQDDQIDFLLPSINTHEIIAMIAENGGFRKQILVSGILLPTDVQVGDFNGDGLMDMVSVSFQTNKVFVTIQQNSGLFFTHTLPELVLGPRKIVVADFDDDNDQDFLVASSIDHSINLFSNQGQGEFNKQNIDAALSGVRFVSLCDLNGDNYPDFVASASNVDTVYKYINFGLEGQFAKLLVDNELFGVNATICVDVDNDQKQELISIASLTSQIYLNELSEVNSRTLIASRRDGYVSVHADIFEKNGTIKLLTQSYFENRNLFYEPNGINVEKVVWEDFPDGVESVDIADINNDGKQDIISASFRDDKIQWYDGSNFQHHLIAENIDGASMVVAKDLDADGLVDVLTAASYANSFYWHKNLGNNQFQTITIFNNARFANGIAVADVNGDNKLDVVGTSGSDDSVRWFNRVGDKFDDYLIDSTNDAPNNIHVTDLDGDDDIDLVVPNLFSDNLSIYINDGTASFIQTIVAENKDKAYGVFTLESELNDYKNIFLTASGENEVYEYQNDGNGYHELLVQSGAGLPRDIVGSEATKKIIFISRSENEIIEISKNNNEYNLNKLISDYMGISGLGLTADGKQLVVGSMVESKIDLISHELIFKNSFSLVIK